MIVRMLSCAMLMAILVMSVTAAPVVAQTTYVARSSATAVTPRPPKGWKMAWTDGRLNPLRGIGTPRGEVQQDQVWQRSLPMVLVSDPLPKQPGLGGVVGLHVKAMPTAVPTQQTVSTGLIQVGSFGIVADAQSTAARLAAMGLPVSTAISRVGSQIIKTVYAGPFGSAAEARAGLTTVHNAGFPGALLR